MKQLAVQSFDARVLAYYRGCAAPPTYVEVGRLFGVSADTAQNSAKRLFRAGLLRRREGTGKGCVASLEATPPELVGVPCCRECGRPIPLGGQGGAK